MMSENKFQLDHALVFWHESIAGLLEHLPQANCFVLADENLRDVVEENFPSFPCFYTLAGEACKELSVTGNAIDWLLENGANRQSHLIGIGGGALTDLAGFVAATFMRGIAFHAVPTTVLAMVDAAWGGKNGVNTAGFKNMMGTIRQPNSVTTEMATLTSLPADEWANGFAEITKHAFLGNTNLMALLVQNDLPAFRSNPVLMRDCVALNVRQKMQVVMADVQEKHERKQLNFGHTLGHALEKLYPQKHGFAIAQGMLFAAWLGAQLGGPDRLEDLRFLLPKFGLPGYQPFDAEAAFRKMLKDKKNASASVQMVLLDEQTGFRLQDFGAEQMRQFLLNYQAEASQWNKN